MVKKVIVITCLIASLLIFLDTIDIVHGLVMFLLAGVIPGTNIALTPNQMLIFMLVLIALATYRFVAMPLRAKILQQTASKKRPASRRIHQT